MLRLLRRFLTRRRFGLAPEADGRAWVNPAVLAEMRRIVDR